MILPMSTLVLLLCLYLRHGTSLGALALDPSRLSGIDKEMHKPHILMVVMDDLGSHDLGIHGSGIRTPHADALAKRGVYLDQYYVLPYCSPTRAALMSGKYPLHTGLHDIVQSRSTAGLPLSEETIADLLKRAGYRTTAVGKWHLGHSSWEQTPTFRGFDEFYGFYLGGQDYYSHKSIGGYDMRHDREPRCGRGCSQVVDQRGVYSSPLFADAAIRMVNEYVEQSKLEGEPLFQYLAFQAVHCPNEVPQRYIDLYKNQTSWTDKRKNYAGMLTAADEAMGRVIQAWKDAGLWNNTLVVFTTDNGGPTTVGCVQGSSNFPKRGGKCSLWEGGTTGDGLLSGPALSQLGVPSGGRRFPFLFHVVDWLPTLAEWVHVVPRNWKDLDGVSQVASLSQESFQVPARTELFMGYARLHEFDDYHDHGSWFGPSLRHLHWKIVQGDYAGPDDANPNPNGTANPMPGGLDGSNYLLFDLNADPFETTNVANDHPDVLQDLIYKLKLYQQSYVPPQVNDDSLCPFQGFVNTSLGPTWEPWCEWNSSLGQAPMV